MHYYAPWGLSSFRKKPFTFWKSYGTSLRHLNIIFIYFYMFVINQHYCIVFMINKTESIIQLCKKKLISPGNYIRFFSNASINTNFTRKHQIPFINQLITKRMNTNISKHIKLAKSYWHNCREKIEKWKLIKIYCIY